MSCGVGHRCDLDPVLLWLWHSPAAVALTQPLAWEPPYAMSVALKSKKKKKKKKKLTPKRSKVKEGHSYHSFCFQPSSSLFFQVK